MYTIETVKDVNSKQLKKLLSIRGKIFLLFIFLINHVSVWILNIKTFFLLLLVNAKTVFEDIFNEAVAFLVCKRYFNENEIFIIR